MRCLLKILFVCVSLIILGGKAKEKKKLCTIPHLESDFGTCIHNYSGIMDVLQGTLAFASESWGELTLSWLIIEQFLKFNHIWPPVFLFVVEAVIFKLGLRPSSGWLLIQAVLLLRLDLLLLPIVLLSSSLAPSGTTYLSWHVLCAQWRFATSLKYFADGIWGSRAAGCTNSAV